MTLPVMPSTHSWVQGGPILEAAGRNALFASDNDQVWVWDEDTGLQVTNLLDAGQNPITTVPIVSGRVDGVGVPVATVLPSFSVGKNGPRFYALPVQVIRNANGALAANDTQVAGFVNTGGSATDGALKGRYPVKASVPRSLADYGVLPGNTAAQNRAGFAAAQASGYLDFILPEGTYQYSAAAEGNWAMTFTNKNRIRIRGMNAVINDTTTFTNNGALTGLFLLDGCKDVEITGIEYVGPALGSPGTLLGYQGATIVSAINATDGVKVDMRATNCRYPVSTGNYATPSQGLCKNFDIKIRGSMVGYAVAMYYADGIRLDIDVDGVHRACYLAGCNDVVGLVRYKNQYIAPYAALLTDCLTSGSDSAAQVAPPANPTTSRGCNNVKLKVMEMGSTTFVADSYVAAISLSRVDPCVFRNIELDVSTVGTASVSTTIHGVAITSTATGVWSRYANNWESTIILEDIVIKGTDDKSASTVSAGTSGSLNIITDTGSSAHAATVRGLSVDGYAIQQPSSGGYVASAIQARGMTSPIVLRRLYHVGAWVALTGSATIPYVLEECTLLTVDVSAGALVSKGHGSTIVATNPTTADLVHTGGLIRGAGPRMRSKQVDATLTGASVTLTAAIPAGCKVDSIQGRLSVAITGASGFQVGVTGDLTRYADLSVTAAGGLMNPSAHAASAITSAMYASATDLVVTAKTANFTAGTLRLVIWYWEYPSLTS